MRHGERLNIRLSEALASALARVSARDGVSPSEWVRRAIARAAKIPREQAAPISAPGRVRE